jgi:hypothetical protein
VTGYITARYQRIRELCNCDVGVVEREDVVLSCTKTPEKFPEAKGLCGISTESQPRNYERVRASDRPFLLVYLPITVVPLRSCYSRRRHIAGAFDATALFMWRSNVLRLRKCSSAGVLRHGVQPRRYSSAKSLPVSEEEFTSVLRGIMPELWGVEGNASLGMWHSAPT